MINFNLYDEINNIVNNDLKDSINEVSFGDKYEKKIKEFFDSYFNRFFLVDSIKENDNCYRFNLKDAKNKKDYVMMYFNLSNSFYIFPKKYDGGFEFNLENYEKVLFDNDKIVIFKDGRHLTFMEFCYGDLLYKIYDLENYDLYRLYRSYMYNSFVLFRIYSQMIVEQKMIDVNNLFVFLNKFIKELGGQEVKKSDKKIIFTDIDRCLKCNLSLYLDKVLNGYEFVDVGDSKVMIDINNLILYKVENNEKLRIIPSVENKNTNKLIALENKDKELIYFEFNNNYILVNTLGYDKNFNINNINSKYYDSMIFYYLIEKEKLDLCSLIDFFVNNYEEIIEKYKLIPIEEFNVEKLKVPCYCSPSESLSRENFIKYNYFVNGKEERISSCSIKGFNVLDVYEGLLKETCSKKKK